MYPAALGGSVDGNGVRAVLFGLYNTLIPSGTKSEREAVVRAMGDDLGVDSQAYLEVVAASFDDRVRGIMPDLPYTVRHLARQIGGSPTESQVEKAVGRRLEFSLSLHAGTWALPTLRTLRARGFRLGVVDDCSHEIPAIWSDSPLAEVIDTTSFSCETGVRKPAPGAYRVAAAALGVRTTECVYVGYGGSHELSGADQAGMRAVRFKAADLAQAPRWVIDPDTDWSGPVIGRLESLVGMLEIPAPRVEPPARAFEVGNTVPWASRHRSRRDH